jgi:anaerobic magnesium-protoporphyrin IX monomethyl ester cyclase
MTKEYKSILLVKLPECTHPNDTEVNNDCKKKQPFRPVPSLALATLSAFFEKYNSFGYKLNVVDLNIEAYTKPGENIEISSLVNLLQSCLNTKYNVLALSTMYVFNAKWVADAVKTSKKNNPQAKIIVGGGFPSIFPEKCLMGNDIDDVVIGEGEATLLHILNGYNNYVDEEFNNKFVFNGFATKNKDGKFALTPLEKYLDLKDLPEPDWSALNVKNYFENSGNTLLPIEASRGCPFKCTYCSTNLQWGYKVRYKSIDQMIEEILNTRGKYKDVEVHFIDDNMAVDKKWIKELLHTMVERKIKIDGTASNFDIRLLDREIIELLVKVGVKEFAVAIESASPEIQREIKKYLRNDQVKEIVGIMMEQEGLYVHLNWMVGFPNESLKQIQATFNFAKELNAHSNQFLTVLPYPGTELFEKIQSDNLLDFNDVTDLGKFHNRACDYIKSDEWNFESLSEMTYDANIEINFLNNIKLETNKGMEKMFNLVKGLLKTLPEHVIALITAGYIAKKIGKTTEWRDFYEKAIKQLNRDNPSKTFAKYLLWDNRIIHDFNLYADTSITRGKNYPIGKLMNSCDEGLTTAVGQPGRNIS